MCAASSAPVLPPRGLLPTVQAGCDTTPMPPEPPPSAPPLYLPGSPPAPLLTPTSLPELPGCGGIAPITGSSCGECPFAFVEFSSNGLALSVCIACTPSGLLLTEANVHLPVHQLEPSTPLDTVISCFNGVPIPAAPLAPAMPAPPPPLLCEDFTPSTCDSCPYAFVGSRCRSCTSNPATGQVERVAADNLETLPLTCFNRSAYVPHGRRRDKAGG